LWTTPANTVKFHFVWSNVTLSENHTLESPDVIRNWWAANAVGTSMQAAPGQQQSTNFPLNGTGDYYVAMFAWDSIGNISPMSNVAKSSNDTFPGVSTTMGTSSGVASTLGTGSTGSTTQEGQASFATYVKPWIAVLFVAVMLLF
jgi:hypothetical protein